MRTVMSRYKVGFASPKDFGSHYKLIFHKGFLCNPHNPEASTDKCRACGQVRESITHFGECSALRPIFEIMRKFDKAKRWDDRKMNLLGVNEMKGVIPEGTSTVHFVLWKFIIIQLTLVSIEGKPFSNLEIVEFAMRRLARKLTGIQYAMTCAKHKAESRGCQEDGTPFEANYSKFEKWVTGVATIEDGKLIVDTELLDLFSIHDVDWKSPPHNSGPS